ncbi:winged helix-turn-helix domain-containing protein, partial [Streptomyces sp. SID11233]|nr:winged helix-turn-helix domain-containing protein [Streptomyces sp. SID11233]
RRKLGETAATPRYLHTLRGVGVKLDPPVREPAPTPTLPLPPRA